MTAAASAELAAALDAPEATLAAPPLLDAEFMAHGALVHQATAIASLAAPLGCVLRAAAERLETKTSQRASSVRH